MVSDPILAEGGVRNRKILTARDSNYSLCLVVIKVKRSDCGWLGRYQGCEGRKCVEKLREVIFVGCEGDRGERNLADAFDAQNVFVFPDNVASECVTAQFNLSICGRRRTIDQRVAIVHLVIFETTGVCRALDQNSPGLRAPTIIEKLVVGQKSFSTLSQLQHSRTFQYAV